MNFGDFDLVPEISQPIFDHQTGDLLRITSVPGYDDQVVHEGRGGNPKVLASHSQPLGPIEKIDKALKQVPTRKRKGR